MNERMIFEGSPLQVKMMKELIANALKKEYGENDLPKLKECYSTGNLWQVNDVQAQYPYLDDEECLIIMGKALENESVVERIHETIDHYATELIEEDSVKVCSFTNERMFAGWFCEQENVYIADRKNVLKYVVEYGFKNIEEAYEADFIYYTEWVK